MAAIITLLILRLGIPLIILFRPLAGALLAVTADLLDFKVLEYFGWGPIDFPAYQKIDKALDLYYLTVAFSFSQKIDDKLARKVFLWLFVWRLAAVITFQLTEFRQALFWGPNVFEAFFILYFLLRFLYKDFRLKNDRRLSFILVSLGIFKLVHEYSLHVDSLKKLLSN